MEFFFGAVAAVLLMLLVGGGRTPSHDDTDPPGGHSGMTIHTDERSGCQYLTTIRGGLTPRLDRDGKHICRHP